jgi:hypothetical protein
VVVCYVEDGTSLIVFLENFADVWVVIGEAEVIGYVRRLSVDVEEDLVGGR